MQKFTPCRNTSARWLRGSVVGSWKALGARIMPGQCTASYFLFSDNDKATLIALGTVVRDVFLLTA